jgi:hypothetical protein
MSNAGFCIASNPDITGIGVRTAIYVQNLLSFFPAVFTLLDKKVSLTELESLETQSTTILITAFAILLSAIVQALTLGLTNYHATIILNLSWINNTNTFIYFILFFYNRVGLRTDRVEEDTNRRVAWICMKDALRNPVLLIGSFHLSLMAAVGIWLWSNPSHFGLSPPCAVSTSLVVIGRSIPLTSKGLQAWSIMVYSLLLIPVLNLIIPIVVFVGPFLVYHRLNSRSSGFGRSISPIAAGFTVLLSINIILLADTEAAIGRNSSFLEHGDTAWTFGQTLALLLLLVPVRDLVETFLERRPKRLGKKLLEGAGSGKRDVVEYVLELGANPEIKGKQYSP